MARRTRRKKTRFAENPPSRNHHWPVPLPKDWQIIPLDYPRRRRSQRFAHCAFTVRSRITRRTRTSSATNVHTRTLAKTGRLNGCFSLDSRAHIHAHLVSTVSHRRDARREHEPRKKKEKITTTWHTCPATFFTRVCGFGLATTRSSTGFLNFFFFYELFWNGKLIRTSVTIYSQRFSFYI